MTKGQESSRKQEKRITKSLSEIQDRVKRTKASGALWYQKSDVVTEEFQIECKTKEKPSKQITLKKEWLQKIKEEAFQTSKTPLLVFSFGDGEDYFVLRSDDFLERISKTT
jgi:hypothetical protein